MAYSEASNLTYVAISGGVGGAKLALGLSQILEPARLAIVANTGDDFEHLGLKISPDLDTVMYTLADLSNKELGWGLADESWHLMGALDRLGGETWFRLGDQDLATHLLRSQMLEAGQSLSAVTRYLCEKLGVRHALIPMTDDQVSTIVHLKSAGSLSFQHYFVRDRCQPEVTGFEFDGLSEARASHAFLQVLAEVTGASILCPSNPFVSIDPVLKLDGVSDMMKAAKAPVIAVSPIVGGQALKGPAAKMMTELGMPRSALTVASHYVKNYPGLLDGFVIDRQDALLAGAVEKLGLRTLVTHTVMKTLADRVKLGQDILKFASSL